MVKRFVKASRNVAADPRFRSVLVAKFVNNIMHRGKKSVALGSFYEAMDIIAKKVTEVPPLEVFETAVANVKPLIEVRSRRVGGATYQVPVEVNRIRQQALAIRWILNAARSRKGMPMSRKLAEEIVAAYRKEGAAMTTRENIHRMAEANKAFAHFAW